MGNFIFISMTFSKQSSAAPIKAVVSLTDKIQNNAPRALSSDCLPIEGEERRVCSWYGEMRRYGR